MQEAEKIQECDYNAADCRNRERNYFEMLPHVKSVIILDLPSVPEIRRGTEPLCSFASADFVNQDNCKNLPRRCERRVEV